MLITRRFSAKKIKKRAEEQKNLDHLYESLKTVLGEDADEIIANGEYVPGERGYDGYLRYQNFAFKSSRGGWCGDADNFNFCVLKFKDGQWVKPLSGWHIIRETIEIGRLINERAKAEAENAEKRFHRQAEEAKPRKDSALMFDAVANRFQRGYEGEMDKLLLAIKTFWDNIQGNDDDSDDDSDDDE